MTQRELLYLALQADLSSSPDPRGAHERFKAYHALLLRQARHSQWIAALFAISGTAFGGALTTWYGEVSSTASLLLTSGLLLLVAVIATAWTSGRN